MPQIGYFHTSIISSVHAFVHTVYHKYTDGVVIKDLIKVKRSSVKQCTVHSVAAVLATWEKEQTNFQPAVPRSVVSGL